MVFKGTCSSYITIQNCNLGDRPIEMTSCAFLNIEENTFCNSEVAIILNNCYGQASIKNNFSSGVNRMVSVNDSMNLSPSISQSQKIQPQKIVAPICLSKKKDRTIEIKHKKIIQQLHSLEAEAKFIKNYKKVKFIRHIKANLGALNYEIAFKLYQSSLK